MTPYQVTQELQQAALRMQLCHKACEGIPTESLVAHGVVAFEEVIEIIKQRDALFDALSQLSISAEISNDCQYGTLSTSFVSEVAKPALALVPTQRIIRQGIFKGNDPSERPHHPVDFNGVVFNNQYQGVNHAEN